MSKSGKMGKFIVQSHRPLRGMVRVAGDKSLSHRAVLLGAIADGVSHVRGFLPAGDTEATLACVQALGVRVERHDEQTLTIYGGSLHAPKQPLNFVNAGTGIRLAAGLLAGQPFASVLDGSEQLRRRPMKRIIEPLRMMGANISGTDDKAPLTVQPARLKGITYEMTVASAQVKSALLLAGLYAEGATTVIEPADARDHTERMLRAMGAHVTSEGGRITLTPTGKPLQPLDMTVPSDFSSAAFLIVAGSIVPHSNITLTGVNLNPTRTGLLDALDAMGANITVHETGLEGGEPVGDIRIKPAALRGAEVGGALVVRMIDEFPIFMIAALCAEGETLVRDAQELRVKETDRIAVMAAELRKLGAQVEEREDGFRIVGRQTLKGATVDAHDDHRVAMSMAVAGMVAEGETVVEDADCASDSFPRFAETLQLLGAGITYEA